MNGGTAGWPNPKQIPYHPSLTLRLGLCDHCFFTGMLVSFQWWKQTSRVEDECKLRGDMDERSEKWIEHAGRGKADTNGIYDKSSIKILENDAAAVSCDANGVHKLIEIVSDQNYICALPGHI